MNALPVISRELRAESRRPLNFWLRWLAAGVLLSVLAFASLNTELDAREWGLFLFDSMRRTLLRAFWILVPLMTADSVNRERREGTLGLLFLTPLTVLDVILAKAAIHALRALTLFLAALPVLGVPFVLGGVEWEQGVLAVFQLGNAVLLGIAAGIFASVKGGSAIQVMVLAELCALGLAVISSPWTLTLQAALLNSVTGIALLCVCVACSLLLFGLVLQQSVMMLRRNWHDESATPERPRWIELLVAQFTCSPVWSAILRWDRKQTLGRNPVAWLQEYSDTARLTKWGWFFGLLTAEFFAVVSAPGSWQGWLAAAVALGLAFSAAGSFRREDQTGLLELLLVTPLSDHKVLNGRVWGIFSHFFPAVLLLVLAYFGLQQFDPKSFRYDVLPMIFSNPFIPFALITVGLFLSLRRFNFFLAWLMTWVAGFVIPIFLATTLQRLNGLSSAEALTIACIFEFALAVATWYGVLHGLRSRAFLKAMPATA